MVAAGEGGEDGEGGEGGVGGGSVRRRSGPDCWSCPGSVGRDSIDRSCKFVCVQRN